MQEKPFIFKHKWIIIILLLFILLNYFSLAMNLYNLSIALLFISIALVIVMVRDASLIFYGERNIKKDIRHYVVKNYNEQFLQSLQEDLTIAIENNNTMKQKDNFNLIYIWFENVINEKNARFSLGKIENLCTDSFRNIFSLDNSKNNLYCLEYMLSFYKLANGDIKNPENIYPLSIWDNINREFYRIIPTISFEKISETKIISHLHTALYYNMNMKDHNGNNIPDNCYELNSYASRIFYYLFINAQTNPADINRQRIKKWLYDDIIYLINYSKFHKFSEEKKAIAFEELSLYTKTLIDYYETDILEDCFFDLFSYNKPLDLSYYNYISSILIYLYYLSQREELAGNKTKKYVVQLIKNNRGFVNNYLSQQRFYSYEHNILKSVYRRLRSWEIMPQKNAKWMVMENVIEDFYIFCILEWQWEEKSLYNTLKPILSENPFSYFSRYFEHNEHNTTQLYMDFANMFLFKQIDKEQAKIKVNMLKSVLTRVYKEVEILNSQEKKLSDEELQSYVAKAKKIFDSELQSVFSYFSNINEDELQYCQYKKISITPLSLLTSFIDEHFAEGYLGKFFKDGVVNMLLLIIKDHVIWKNTSFDNHEKLSEYFSTLESLGLQINAVIGNKDTFYGDSKTEEYQEYIKDKIRIKSPGGTNYLLGIDTKLIYAKISNVDIKIVDFTDEDINNCCKCDENGNYLYNITNSIYLPFSKDELHSYLYNIRKKIIVDAKASFFIRDSKIGGGIKILF